MMSNAQTVLDALAERLADATSHNHATERRPVVVLFTDGDNKWRAALPALRNRLPHLWTLGTFNPDLNQGPAAWVKWRLGHVADGDPVPVLYLPGVRRLQFRSLEDFPDDLKPIAELQFRGTWWTQSNGKDWTPFAFLSSSNGGLGLTVSEDQATVIALDKLVGRVVQATVAELAKGHVDFDRLVALLVDDVEGAILGWLDDPVGFRAAWPDAEWGLLRNAITERLAVDIDHDGPIVVGEHLVQRSGGWAKVWNRYVSAVPSSYSKVHLVLEKAVPSTLMFDPSTLPKYNDEQEKALRVALAELADQPEAKARQRVRELETAHGLRRGWVWAKLGKARMAEVLQHLVSLANATEGHAGGSHLEGVASWYSKTGSKADTAALAALAMAEHANAPAIQAAVRTLYLPWLQRAAEHLRDVVQAAGYPKSQAVPVEDGTCLLFADGLRWDVGAVLASRLQASGNQVFQDGRWVAFPPVTGTSKPDISPIRDLLVGGTGAADFTPCVKATNKPIDSATFRKLMAAAGYQVLDDNATGDPKGRGWTEFGDIDKYGHKHGCKTARHVDDQVRELEQRIAELLAAGWQRVRVTTDHGWLLVPGGMPDAKVAPGLAESRWSRCAVLKATSKADLPSLPWAWDPTVEVTYAPGVCAFRAGTEYSHGGLTLQECYTPILTVTRNAPATVSEIAEVKWANLRCRAKVNGATAGLRFDLRAKVTDAASSVLDAPVAVAANGTCTVLVPDDSKEGNAAFAVLLAMDGTVLGKLATTVGGEQ